MSTQSQPAPVLAWHREVVRKMFPHGMTRYGQEELAAIIAAHDPHTETVRLLEEAIKAGDIIAAHFDPGPIPANEPTQSDMDFGDWEYHRQKARAHLAALKGTQ